MGGGNPSSKPLCWEFRVVLAFAVFFEDSPTFVLGAMDFAFTIVGFLVGGGPKDRLAVLTRNYFFGSKSVMLFNKVFLDSVEFSELNELINLTPRGWLQMKGGSCV